MPPPPPLEIRQNLMWRQIQRHKSCSQTHPSRVAVTSAEEGGEEARRDGNTPPARLPACLPACMPARDRQREQ